MQIVKTFPFVARKHLSAWYTQVHNSMALTGWVILGLGLITLLAAILAQFPDWLGPIFFGPKTAVTVMNKGGVVGNDIFMISVSDAGNLFWILTPVVLTILLYICLSSTGITLIQPRLFPWPQRRILYLLVLILTLLLVGILIVPRVLPGATGPFQYCLILYAFVAYARVALSKKNSWLVEGSVLAVVLLILIIFSPQLHTAPAPSGINKALGYKQMKYQSDDPNQLPLRIPPIDSAVRSAQVDDPNQLLLRVPLVGIQVGLALQWFEAFIWAIGLLCLHIFTGIGVHERAARQRSEMLIKELTQTQEQLRAYALHAEELAIMRERTRVAREVHDTLAQGLAAIKMHLETSSKVFQETPDLAQKHIERARELAGEYLQETRHSILDLRTGVLQSRTLPTALAELVARATSTHGATINVSGIEEKKLFWQTLSPAIELTCYRIMQEALSNATRHGQASHIDVELSLEKDVLCLTITDNGRGFEPAELPASSTGGGFGIIGMHERLKQLSGRLEIISAPGAGTQVVAMIPLASAQSDSIDTTERQRSEAR